MDYFRFATLQEYMLFFAYSPRINLIDYAPVNGKASNILASQAGLAP
jgi:hypothetical protein